MKQRHFMPLLAASLALASCQPDSPADLAGGLLLNIENTASAGAKPAVSGITTTWLNGDVISINGAERTVRVIGNVARVTDVTAPNPGEHFFACSPADLFSVSGSNDFWWEHPIGSNQRSLGFTYPREYTYDIAPDGRQSLASPMVAVAESDADALTFRHLAAAVEVHLSNPMNVGCYIDSIVVEAAHQSLNGTGYFTLNAATGTPNVSAPAEYDHVYARRSVRLNTGHMLLSAGGSRALQVPVPPLPQGEELTVRVYGTTSHTFNHNSVSGFSWVAARNATYSGDLKEFVFSHSATLGSRLQRNHLLKARAEISPDGHLLDSERSISRLSLFSLSGTKKVLFKRDQDTDLPGSSWTTPTRAEMEYLLNDRPGARFAQVKMRQQVFVDYTYFLVIFPDGHTAESVRSLPGMSALDANSFNRFSLATTLDMTPEEMRQHGFLVLNFSSRVGIVIGHEQHQGIGYRLADENGSYSLFFTGIGNSTSSSIYSLCVRSLIGD